MKTSSGLVCALLLTLFLLPHIVSGRSCRSCSCQAANSKADRAEKELHKANHANAELKQKNIALGEDFAVRVSAQDGSLIGFIHDEFSPTMTLPPNSQMKIVPRSFPGSGTFIRLYYDTNNKGLFTDLSIPGNYTASQISLPRFSVSSLTVPPGFQVIMYTQDGFNGEHIVVSGSVSNLDKFNDRTQSIEITKDFVKEPDHLAVVYSHSGYSGKQHGLILGPNTLLRSSNLNSISIQPGYEVLIYTPDTMTLLDIIHSSSSSIIPNPLRTDATNLHVVVQPTTSTPGGTPYAILHADIDFKGQHFIVRQNTNLDGTLSSIQVPSGYEAVLYEQLNQQGSYIVLSGDVRNLLFYAFNDRAKSVLLRLHTPREDVVIYTKPNYAGDQMIVPIGRSECSSSLKLLNFCENVYAASIKVPEGFKATLTKAPTPITHTERVYTYLEDTPEIRNYVDTLLVSVVVEKM
jgi:hypothetical protein